MIWTTTRSRMIESEDGRFAIYQRDLQREIQFLVYEGLDLIEDEKTGRPMVFAGKYKAMQFVEQLIASQEEVSA